MRDLFLLLAKGLLWILLVLLLRPINYLMDVTLASYAKLSQLTDSDDLPHIRKTLIILILSIFFLIVMLWLGYLNLSKGPGLSAIPLISPTMSN